MTKMKTAELSGAYLSLFVAKVLGYKDCFVNLQGDCVQAYIKNGITQYREIRFDNKPDVILRIVKNNRLCPIWSKRYNQWYVEIDPSVNSSVFQYEVFFDKNLENTVLRAFVYTKFGGDVEIDL